MDDVVETARLRLRPFRPDDLEPLAALHAHPAVWRYPLGRGMTRDETAAFLERRLQARAEQGFDLWAAEGRDAGALVGWLGLAVPDFLPEILPAVEVGWRLHPDHWGRGLATEGGEAALRYGFEVLDVERIVSVYEPANVASGRVMARLGMHHDRDTVHPARGLAVRVLAIAREEWRARGPLDAGW